MERGPDPTLRGPPLSRSLGCIMNVSVCTCTGISWCLYACLPIPSASPRPREKRVYGLSRRFRELYQETVPTSPDSATLQFKSLRGGWQSPGHGQRAPGKPAQGGHTAGSSRGSLPGISKGAAFGGCWPQLVIYRPLPQNPLVHFCWWEGVGGGGQRTRVF